jgi:hypothetical protein
MMLTRGGKQYNYASEQNRHANDDAHRGSLGRDSGHCLFGADAADDAGRA